MVLVSTLLQLRHSSLFYSGKFWLGEVFTFINYYNIKIYFPPEHWIFRKHDIFIMNVAEQGQHNLKILSSINKIKLRIGAMVLSNIFDGNGKRINIDIFERENRKLITKWLSIRITQEDIFIWNKLVKYLEWTYELVPWYCISKNHRRIDIGNVTLFQLHGKFFSLDTNINAMVLTTITDWTNFYIPTARNIINTKTNYIQLIEHHMNIIYAELAPLLDVIRYLPPRIYSLITFYTDNSEVVNLIGKTNISNQ